MALGIAEQNLLSAEGGGQAAGMQFVSIDMVAREGAYDDILLKARRDGCRGQRLYPTGMFF